MCGSSVDEIVVAYIFMGVFTVQIQHQLPLGEDKCWAGLA